MGNERLRKAMVKAHVSIDEIAEATQVSPKTVQRWLAGRVPYPRHRWAVAELVDEDERYLWADADRPVAPGAPTTAEVLAAYAHRADLSREQWWNLINDARRQVDLLGYAMLFLPEQHPRLTSALAKKAAEGCAVRIALADPDAPEVAERDAEEQLDGGLVARIRTALRYFSDLKDAGGVAVHLHRTKMYNSLFRFDDEMLVTPHIHGVPGYSAPLLHLRRLGPGGLFDNFAGHFERVWESSTPVERWP